MLRKYKETVNFTLQLPDHFIYKSAVVREHTQELPNPWHGCNCNNNVHHYLRDGETRHSSN